MSHKKKKLKKIKAKYTTPCPNCGLFQKHWVSYGSTGFWTCPKLYNTDTGRRIVVEPGFLKSLWSALL